MFRCPEAHHGFIAWWLLIQVLPELGFRGPLSAELGDRLGLEGTSSGAGLALKALQGPHTLLPLEQVDTNEVIIPDEGLWPPVSPECHHLVRVCDFILTAPSSAPGASFQKAVEACNFLFDPRPFFLSASTLRSSCGHSQSAMQRYGLL